MAKSRQVHSLRCAPIGSKRWPDAAKWKTKTQMALLWARNDGYRSGNRRLKGRLLARNLYLEHQPLSDRVAHESRSSPQARAIVVVNFPTPKGGSGFRRGHS